MSLIYGYDDDNSESQADLTSLTSKVASNKTSIDNLSASQSTNVQKITTNKIGLALTKRKVTTNKSDIATNAQEIQSNENAITNLTNGQVETNKNDIAANVSKITSLTNMQHIKKRTVSGKNKYSGISTHKDSLINIINHPTGLIILNIIARCTNQQPQTKVYGKMAYYATGSHTTSGGTYQLEGYSLGNNYRIIHSDDLLRKSFQNPNDSNFEKILTIPRPINIIARVLKSSHEGVSGVAEQQLQTPLDLVITIYYIDIPTLESIRSYTSVNR